MAIRKALFSKPKWAAKSPEPFESDEPPSIFQQNVYEDILEEQRKKQERKVAKQRERDDLAHKQEAHGQSTKSDDDKRAVKKRRISSTPIDLEREDDKDEDDAFDEVASGSESDSRSTKSKKSRERNSPANDSEPDRPPLRSTRKKTRSQADEPEKSSSTRLRRKPVSVDDDDDEELIIYEPEPTTKPLPAQRKPKSKPKPPLPPESESDSEEDEYLKELKRKAREDAKAKNTRATTSNAGTDQTLQTLHSPTNDSPDADQTTAPTAPTVQIYIHTILPNCPPLGIIRRPSQTLESVHKHFCDTHNLSDNLRPKVFFTWNNQRLFKSTTTRSIIEQLKRKHGSDKSEGKIVLEAVTDEIFEHRLKQKEDAKRRAEEEALENNDTDGYGDTNGAIPPSAQETRADTAGAAADPSTHLSTAATTTAGGKSPGVVLKLTSNTPDTLPSMQLRVHAHTAIERIVRGYKSRMGVDVAREVYLVFEGERLDGTTTVGDVGFEDGDCVDVRCR